MPTHTHLVQHPQRTDHVVKPPQVLCPASGDLPRRHVYSERGVVVGGVDGAGVIAVDVCGFTPLRTDKGVSKSQQSKNDKRRW